MYTLARLLPINFSFFASLLLFFSFPAYSYDESNLNMLYRLSARPAGMGGAFMTATDDPIALFWNPASALNLNKFAISGNHSLRHFPGRKKNLDQFDADTTALTIPLKKEAVLGIGFTVPGEWGLDHTDTNGLLPSSEKIRGRERFISFSPSVKNSSRASGQDAVYAFSVKSDWYRGQNFTTDESFKSNDTGGSYSFFFSSANGFNYGISVGKMKKIYKGVRLLRVARNDNKKSKTEKISRFENILKAGVSYKKMPESDTLIGYDIEFAVSKNESGEKHIKPKHFVGVERKFADKFFVRTGLMDGAATYGTGVKLGSIILNYAIVKNILPKITKKDTKSFRDGRFLSYTLQF